jgi:hypothetical protein
MSDEIPEEETPAELPKRKSLFGIDLTGFKDKLLGPEKGYFSLKLAHGRSILANQVNHPSNSSQSQQEEDLVISRGKGSSDLREEPEEKELSIRTAKKFAFRDSPDKPKLDASPSRRMQIDALPVLKQGAVMLKYVSRGIPHFRFIKLDEDLGKLIWFSEGRSLSETSSIWISLLFSAL